MQKIKKIRGNNKTLLIGKKTILMGILNVTPDSFSDGGKFFQPQKAIAHAKRMIDEGALIIDIGGESTRPGAEQISSEEEKKRVIPVLEELTSLFPEILFSIDTYKSEVAKAAINAGADIINDVSGLQLDHKMPNVAAQLDVPIIINHMKGNPKTMQLGEIVYKDVVKDILEFFVKKIALLETSGVSKENIIVDPGFGFGKTVDQNLEILQRLQEFTVLGLPVLVGVSRKSSFGKILQEEFNTENPFPADDRIEASLAATAIAVLHGASIIRTHDVLETRKFLTVIERLK